MRDPKPVEGGRALLFERLAADDEPHSPEGGAWPFRVIEVRAPEKSTRDELWLLLEEWRRAPRRGGGHGLPDAFSLSAASDDDRRRLASRVAAALTDFEPRLRDVQAQEVPLHSAALREVRLPGAEAGGAGRREAREVRQYQARHHEVRRREGGAAAALRVVALFAVGGGDVPVSFLLEEKERPARVLDVQGLRRSVWRELRSLLNTRRHGRPWRPGEGEALTVLDYGLPDFSSLSASSGADQERLAGAVAAAVAAFEPRLRDVRVRVERLRQDDRALLLRVEARLVVGTHAEPVAFELACSKSGEMCVDEDDSE